MTRRSQNSSKRSSKAAESPTTDPDQSTDISSPTSEPEPELPPEQQVQLWFLEGHTAADVAQAIRQKWPRRKSTKLIEDALNHFATHAYPDPATLRGWCFEALREMYRRMVAIGDYANAMKCIKELHKIASAEMPDVQNDQTEQPPAG